MGGAEEWRKKAEEYRTFADACGTDVARQGFLALAESSEHIAELEERHLHLERTFSASPALHAE